MARPRKQQESSERKEEVLRAKVMCGLPESATSAQLAAAAASPPVGSQLHARCKANAIEAGVRCGVIDPAGRERWEQAAEADLVAVESSLAQVALLMATPEHRAAVSASVAPRMVLRDLAGVA